MIKYCGPYICSNHIYIYIHNIWISSLDFSYRTIVYVCVSLLNILQAYKTFCKLTRVNISLLWYFKHIRGSYISDNSGGGDRDRGGGGVGDRDSDGDGNGDEDWYIFTCEYDRKI